MKTKTLGIILLLTVLSLHSSAQNSWNYMEKTSIYGSISGTITQGYIFKTFEGDYYIVSDLTLQLVLTLNPEVKIYQKDLDYKLVIEDFEEPVICKKLKNIIETQIEGEFKGWEGETIFKMVNGEYWQQSSYAYLYHYAYSPQVMIYEYSGSTFMKVDVVDETIEVEKVNSTNNSSSENVIESQIDGEFEGWEGETIFKLKNGQIWQQSSYTYMYHYAYSPTVIIYKTDNGYVLKVEGVEEKIEVRKLK